MGRHFTSDEKDRALRLVREELQEHGSVTKACSAASSRPGISPDTLRGWCRRGEVDQGRQDGITPAEREEICALKAKLRPLEEDNEVLRRPAVFFAGNSTPAGYQLAARARGIGPQGSLALARPAVRPTSSTRETSALPPPGPSNPHAAAAPKSHWQRPRRRVGRPGDVDGSEAMKNIQRVRGRRAEHDRQPWSARGAPGPTAAGAGAGAMPTSPRDGQRTRPMEAVTTAGRTPPHG